MVQENRYTYLMNWMDGRKWRPSDEMGCPTRVIQSSGLRIKVVINPSRKPEYEGNWSPIIEIEGRLGDVYLSNETVPKMTDAWYQTKELAMLAAFEYLWPSSLDDWEGLMPYYRDMDYEQEYYPWKYGHEYVRAQH